MFTNLAFVDVETTGLRASEDRVTEIAVILVDGDREERWATLLKLPIRHLRTADGLASDDAP